VLEGESSKGQDTRKMRKRSFLMTHAVFWGYVSMHSKHCNGMIGILKYMNALWHKAAPSFRIYLCMFLHQCPAISAYEKEPAVNHIQHHRQCTREKPACAVDAGERRSLRMEKGSASLSSHADMSSKTWSSFALTTIFL